MAKVIKLENINVIKGTRQEHYVEEYVCSNCRHIINLTDKTCWQCGGKLEPSGTVEHYYRGGKLTTQEFNAAKLNYHSGKRS